VGVRAAVYVGVRAAVYVGVRAQLVPAGVVTSDSTNPGQPGGRYVQSICYQSL
jgi:hypothetical protein